MNISKDIGLAELYELSRQTAEFPKNEIPALPPRAKKRTKRRGGRLTVLAVAVGVFSVTVISGAGKIGETQVSRLMDGMGINTLLIEPANRETVKLSNQKSAHRLTESDLQTVADTDGIKEAAPLLSAPSQVNLHGYTQDVLAWGTNTAGLSVFSLSAGAGRFFSDGDVAAHAKVCVLDENIARAAYGRADITGKTAEIMVAGKPERFKIIGTTGTAALASAISGLVPDFVYMPYTTLQDITGSYGYERIAASALPETATSAKQTKNVSENISDTFRRRGGRSDISVIDLLSQKKTLLNIFGAVSALLSAIAGISLLVSGLSVMTAMLTRVSERRREIGIKKSIGATPLRVMTEFLRESLSLSAKGAVFGSIVGLAATAAACAALGLPPAFDINAVIFAVSAALISGGIFGVYPAAVAAKMPPVKALSSVSS